MLKDIEKTINEEFKAKKLDLTVEIRGFEKGGCLTHLSRTSLSIDEKKKINEAMGIVMDKIKKKWFKEF